MDLDLVDSCTVIFVKALGDLESFDFILINSFDFILINSCYKCFLSTVYWITTFKDFIQIKCI